MMHHANRCELPFELRKQLESYMTGQITAQGGPNHLDKGAYTIVAAYAVPVHLQPYEMGQKREDGHKGSYYVAEFHFIARLLLQNSNGEPRALSYPVDEFTSEALKDLRGKRIISDGSTFLIEGSRCNVNDMQMRSDDHLNAISPMYSSSALKREDFFMAMGMLRQEALRPGVRYEIIDVAFSTTTNPLNNVVRGVMDVKVREAKREAVQAETILTDDQLINVRMYFERWEEPLVERAYKFFRQKVAHKFTPKSRISTINRPKNLNQFLANFVGASDEPIMKVGEVYVLDAIYERDNRASPACFFVFHSVDVDAEVEKSDKHVLSTPGVKTFKVNCFGPSPRRNSRQPTAAYMEGRSINDIRALFANAAKDSGSKKCLFSVAEDIYDGMLDYAYFGNAAHGLELIKMEAIDIKDSEAIAGLSRDSFSRQCARGKLLSADMRLRID